MQALPDDRNRTIARGPGASKSEEGVALILVTFVSAALVAMVLALMYINLTQRTVAVNEQDYQKALGYAESGLKWAERRAFDGQTGGFSDVLNGPDNAGAGDDNLIGLRDLSLTATSQFTNANEGTKSAIVTKDLGTGSKKWEVVRFADPAGVKALVYVRIDDNYDDDPNNPASNAPLSDKDKKVRITAIAEYPVFVNGSGVEQTNNIASRGRAVRLLSETIEAGDSPLAVLAGDDVIMTGGLKICGACGAFHTDGDMNITNPPAICHDATASGTWTQSGSPAIGGANGGGYPTKTIPIISPYDPKFAPTPAVFDTSASTLPAHLQCPSGTAKYFALVADSGKGKIFKAYWDSGNSRWKWKMIDDLSDGTDVALDDCGRAPGDTGYTAGVSDGKNDEFYGWKQSVDSTSTCTACGSAGSDTSLCTLANDDYVGNAYYDATTGSKIASIAGSSLPALPGGFPGDGTADFNPTVRPSAGLWENGDKEVYSPLYNSVMFFYGSAKLSNSIGTDKYCKVGAACATPVPNNYWMVSLISYGDIIVTNSPSWAPPTAGATAFNIQLIAGRDIQITGAPSPGVSSSCPSDCSTAGPANIAALAGVIAAHEAIEITGSPDIFGYMIAEHALNCSSTVGAASNFTGAFSLYYDCNHPPYLFSSNNTIVDWAETP